LSKSLLHRSQICAALAGKPALADLGDGELSVDIRATGDCLSKLIGDGSELDAGELLLDCKESGSTLRFLIPLAAALGRSACFVGGGRLPNRPLKEYQDLFRDTDVRLLFPDDGQYLPLHLSGRLQSDTYTLPGNVSSQYISGLLMALPLTGETAEIVLSTELESEPYVNLTIAVMQDFGVHVDRTPTGYRIPGGQRYHRETKYYSEPDFSQAAFWLVASFLGHRVEIEGLPKKSAQGDRASVKILSELERRRDTEESAEYIIDASQIPDLIPVLSVAAAVTPGVTRVIKAGRLRIKECDRLEATREMLEKLGAPVSIDGDSLVIFGRKIEPGKAAFRACEINGYNDHRMVMAASIAATRADGPVVISDSRAIRKSYPNYFEDFRRIGGSAHELDVGK
jgi:3-phosphoshikimate 1-carboxyvinyltransferase